MRHRLTPLVSCLLAALVAFQLLAGVPLCRERGEGVPGDHAGSTSASSTTQGHGGAHGHDGHHDHGDAGRSECPEAFLPAAPHEPAAAFASGRVASPPLGRPPPSTYEVPTPVPIQPSARPLHPKG